MTWLPVRAARRHTNAVRVAQWALVLSTVYLMAWLGVSGLILSHWSHWPVLLMALALGLGFPQVIASRPRRRQWRQRRRRPSPLTLTARVELRWMYRLTITLNAAQFLGRRLVLPTALLGMLAGWGWEAHALPVLGLALGGVALLGALLSVWVGQHTDHQRPEAQAMMGRGLGLTVLGWLLIVLGLVLAAVHAAAWIAVLMGWVLIDMAARLLGVGYMEAMRFAVIEEQTTRGRVHRHALSRFMRMKSVGSVVGLTLAGLTASWGPLVLPVWLAVWIVACWWLWHQRPWQT